MSRWIWYPLWWCLVGCSGDSVDATGDPSATDTAAEVTNAVEPAPAERGRFELVTHVVTPGETLGDIAARYRIKPRLICRLNGLGCDERPLAPGSKLVIEAVAPPLPTQRFVYTVEPGEDAWSILSERFDVPVDRLRAFNPELTRPAVGDTIALWVEPQVPRRKRSCGTIPRLEAREDARSLGAPNNGSLEEGVQLPASTLYERRRANIMFGSAFTVQHLWEAIACFRYRYAYHGQVVVADISRRAGGLLPPHRSHQSGRDVDLWLPTLQGVYKPEYLAQQRWPRPEEVNWFAVWGLIEALIETGAVREIFLSYELQDRVYHAARQMGVPELVLYKQLQRGPNAPKPGTGRRPFKGIVRHSPGHTGHMHVRFKCGPNDDEGCRETPERGGPIFE